MKVRVVAPLLVIVFGGGLLVGRSLYDSGSPELSQAAFRPQTIPVGLAPAQTQLLAPGLGEGERRDIEIFRRASRSTVFVNQLTVRRSLFSFNVSRIQQGSGTGIVWDTDGHIVTNYHVLQTRDPRVSYSVTLWDHSEWDAEIIGTASEKDLAVLRIKAPREQLHPIEVGSSANLAVGQKVLALGNPFGLDQTLTMGIVSALGRDLESPDGRTIRDVIQSDAAINPGNSGGPLLDSSGRLIGVNTAIASPSGASAGIGFAVPVDTVARLVPRLIRHGAPIRPGIGVTVLTDTAARSYGFEGVVITDVVEGMAADRAGIEPLQFDRRGRFTGRGDKIVAVNGKRVRLRPELQDAFEDAGGVGAKVTLTLLNAGRRRDVEITLVEIN